MKKVQYEECNIKKVRATRKKRNMKRVQHEENLHKKSATRKK